MSYNTKNYSENGDKLVIGGTMETERGHLIVGKRQMDIGIGLTIMVIESRNGWY